jgi:hypothetical protein
MDWIEQAGAEWLESLWFPIEKDPRKFNWQGVRVLGYKDWRSWEIVEASGGSRDLWDAVRELCPCKLAVFIDLLAKAVVEGQDWVCGVLEFAIGVQESLK